MTDTGGRTGLDESLLTRLNETLGAQMGLHYPKRRWGDLERGIAAAARAFGMESPEIDWRELHARLDAARKALEQARSPRPEEKKEILRARARALAREPKRAETHARAIDMIEFVLAYERYALESTFVREVYPLKELTTVPCTPAYIAGIVNVRGQIVTVLDIRKFFDLPQKGLPDLSKVIILRHDGMEFGILADVIIGTRTLYEDELQGALPTLTGIRKAYLRGVTADQAVVLDAARLLADEKLVVHEEVALSPADEPVRVGRT